MEEIWKPVVGYEDLYEVSNLGKVRSIDRIIVNNLGISKSLKGKILKESIERKGYVTIVLCRHNSIKRKSIHRLVAQAFLPNPFNYPQVNHKNEIKSDNRVENLEWCTCSYNVQYGSREGKQGKARSRKVYRYKPNGNLIDTYSSTTDAGKKLGLPQNSISRACLSDSLYKGYIWSYNNNLNVKL